MCDTGIGIPKDNICLLFDKSDKRLTDTRMIMLTFLGTRDEARRFQQIGFSSYATKPIRHRELMAVLSLALTEQDGIETKLIATHHSAREKMNLFIDRKARILLHHQAGVTAGVGGGAG